MRVSRSPIFWAIIAALLATPGAVQTAWALYSSEPLWRTVGPMIAGTDLSTVVPWWLPGLGSLVGLCMFVIIWRQTRTKHTTQLPAGGGQTAENRPELPGQSNRPPGSLSIGTNYGQAANVNYGTMHQETHQHGQQPRALEDIEGLIKRLSEFQGTPVGIGHGPGAFDAPGLAGMLIGACRQAGWVVSTSGQNNIMTDGVLLAGDCVHIGVATAPDRRPFDALAAELSIRQITVALDLEPMGRRYGEIIVT